MSPNQNNKLKVSKCDYWHNDPDNGLDYCPQCKKFIGHGKVSKCCGMCRGLGKPIPFCNENYDCKCHFLDSTPTPRPKTRPANYRHGMDGTRFYKVWSHMKERCLNKNYMHFNRYGGRGITICVEWMDFMNFKNDMYEAYLEHAKEYTEKDTTLDRIDNDGNYCKENCRWATRKVQQNNVHLNREEFGRKGGLARAKSLSPERRREISKMGNDKKWGKSKERKIKAWAIVSKDNNYEDIRTHKNYHVFSIFQTKKRATVNRPKGWKAGHIWKVVPCEITYKLK